VSLAGSARGRGPRRRLIALSSRLGNGRGVDSGRWVVIAHAPDHAGQHGQRDERGYHPAGVVTGSGLIWRSRCADGAGSRISGTGVGHGILCVVLCQCATSWRAASHSRKGKPKLPSSLNFSDASAVQRRTGGLTSIIGAPPFSGTECGAVSRPLGPPPACGFELLGAPVIWFELP